MTDERSNTDKERRSWVDKLSTLFSTEPRTRSDLDDLLTIARDNKIIDDEAKGIIEGALQVSGMQVRDIMIPRSRMHILELNHPLPKLLKNVIQGGHSRYPVVGENIDDVVGILLVKDLLPQILEPSGADFDLKTLLRKVYIVPESKRLNVLLKEFRENRNHMAVVIDEYGGVAGVITIEDVLEEIVGEIEDETDTEGDRLIRKIRDDDYIVQALTPISEFNEYFGANLSDLEFDTIGGLVVNTFGHMPVRDEQVIIGNFEFTVINADLRRVQSLRLRPARHGDTDE
ncbi:MAG: magnesium/cobalt efflux protein [Gammaproteobacteria bacterium]|nr:MAG: magnesium/cobalt efflux protein [Gammaproteobacteria bacterium]